jgi:hypothetical protein
MSASDASRPKTPAAPSTPGQTVPNLSKRPAADRRHVYIAPTATLKPMVPDVPPLARALDRAAPLSGLLQRLQASQACLAAVKACLPPALATQVKAGPLDEEGWTLLASNASVSAKLRQLQPRLAMALADSGLKVTAIRVKVQSQSG